MEDTFQSKMPNTLQKILEDCIAQSANDFKVWCRARAKNKMNLGKVEPIKKGKRTPSTLFAERKVSFRLPKKCNPENFEDIDEVRSKLRDWKIQNRKRFTSNMRDTYYIHKWSRRVFRSIREVVNYILPDSYPKLPSRKRTKRAKVVEEPPPQEETPTDSESDKTHYDDDESVNDDVATEDPPSDDEEVNDDNVAKDPPSDHEAVNDDVATEDPPSDDEAVNGDDVVTEDPPSDHEAVNDDDIVVAKDRPLDEAIINDDEVKDGTLDDEAINDDVVVAENRPPRGEEAKTNNGVAAEDHAIEEATNDERIVAAAATGGNDGRVHQDEDKLEEISSDFNAYTEFLMEYFS